MGVTTKFLAVFAKNSKEIYWDKQYIMSYTKYPQIRMYWAIFSFLSAATWLVGIPDSFPKWKDSKSILENFPNDNNSIRSACLDNPTILCLSIDEQMIPFHGHVSIVTTILSNIVQS